MPEELSTTESIILSRVGKTLVTREDVTYRQAVEALYRRGAALDDVTSLVGLLNEALHREVARKKDVGATWEDFETLSQHAEESSRDPELLARIKGIFGEDTDAYHRVFLEPKIVPNKLRDFFAEHKGHGQARSKIENVLKEAQEGAIFSEIAEKHALNIREVTLQEPGTAEMHFPMGIEDPMISLVKPLKTGEIHKDIVETDREYQIVRLKSRREGRLKGEIVSAQRPVFEDWFREEVAQIDIVIEDQDIFQDIMRRYGDVWWLRNARGLG